METKKRIIFLSLLFYVLFLVVFLRLINLQIIQHPFYEKKSLEQRKRLIEVSADRGDIYDRNGNLLVTSRDTFSVFTYQDGHFRWVKRKVSSQEAQKIVAQNPQENFVLSEKKRIYPKGNFASQVLGFVGLDNQGLAGIELAGDGFLKGKSGKVITEGDPSGRELYGALRRVEPTEDGMNLTLTLDETLQYLAEQATEENRKKFSAAASILIVMQAKTGEILALASKPDFDPNNYEKSDRQLWHPRFLDPYEPGSTFKLITTASALQEGVITLETKLKALDAIEVGGKIIANSHPVRWTGSSITISKMLEESINTGAVQVSLKLGPEKFYRHIRDFGFGETTGFGLLGESPGIVRHWKSWWKPDIGMMAFGQSIAVTPLQLLSAVSAIANQGRRVKPYLVKKIESPNGKFVKVFSEKEGSHPLSKETAERMKTLMENVVLKGSGRRARMENFRVAGKTGTAQKAILGGRGYMKGHYLASFIGFAPVSDPQIIVLVVVDDPRGSIWGETVGGPIFKKVAEDALRYMNVPPDVLKLSNR